MRSRLWHTIVVAAFVFAVPSGATVSPVEARVDAIVAPYLEAGDFMGVVGIQVDGEEALILPYGRASVELNVAHQPESVFMIGSVSKQFTAAAVLKLEESGALSTADMASKHLPGFPHGAAMTIEQLLTHTSGLADIYSLERFGLTGGREETFEELIGDLGRSQLTFEPGTGYAYSNGGYALLAALVEKAAGVEYGDYLETSFFKPLGMSRTAHDGPGPTVEGRVLGYDPWGNDDLGPAIPVIAAFTTGSGSLWSTAKDLLQWSAALHGGQVLSENSYEKLTQIMGTATAMASACSSGSDAMSSAMTGGSPVTRAILRGTSTRRRRS